MCDPCIKLVFEYLLDIEKNLSEYLLEIDREKEKRRNTTLPGNFRLENELVSLATSNLFY